MDLRKVGSRDNKIKLIHRFVSSEFELCPSMSTFKINAFCSVEAPWSGRDFDAETKN